VPPWRGRHVHELEGITATQAPHRPAGGVRGTPRGSPDGASWAIIRSRDNRVLLGVAGGLGERLGVDPILVRIAFAVLAVAGGSGVLLYLVAWGISVEREAAAPSPAPARRPHGRQNLALGVMVLGVLLLLREVGLWFGDPVVWPVALAAAGAAVIWARSDDRDRARWTRAGALIPGNPVEALFTGRVGLVRIVVGGLLVAMGMGLGLANQGANLAATGSVLLAMATTAAGLGLIFGPWTSRLARQLAEERRWRIRSEARAEMAAHLHDSVLHTLALIQRADSSPEVVALARRQERELRAWLYAPPVPPEGRLRPAVEAIATRVEQLHNVPVDVVVVGDAPLDARARALVDACQEAAFNAARHSGASLVSVYVEVEADQLTGFVRDEGKGFDPEQVPADRRGIADSIRGRMQRHGGAATISSGQGEGTEVQLRMPRAAP
jgi:signal transduction histidine kinase/phage shock protein PspC (stress-responsive transcriptional regulator)